MERFRATTIMVLFGGLTAGGWLYAQGGETTLTGGDIAEIKQLYARYNQGLDFEDAELYLSAFTDGSDFWIWSFLIVLQLSPILFGIDAFSRRLLYCPGA